MPQINEVAEWRGEKLVGADDEKLGKIEDIYYLDDQTDEPGWLAVSTGMFGSKVSFVPLAQARRRDDHVVVPYSKDHVKDAPQADSDGQLPDEEVERLYRHYGLTYFAAPGERGLPAERDVGEPTSSGDAMTRSEEELRVGTTRRETGRARLRKYVVTEEVQTTVPVQREEVRIEREPITDANADEALDGPAMTEDEHEVTLHAEEPVVDKRVVPKERVRMQKETVTEEQALSEELRKEQIEAEGDARS